MDTECRTAGDLAIIVLVLVLFVLNSPSKDGPGIMYKMHIMSPQLQKRKLHQGITENTLAEAS
jgi:hypothetical protein